MQRKYEKKLSNAQITRKTRTARTKTNHECPKLLNWVKSWLIAQLQLATGPNMSMKPKFDGPYTIVSFDEDGVSARIENLDTGRQMRAHFTNMMPINFHPSANRAQTNFDDNLNDISPMLRDRYTLKSKSRLNLNIELDDDELDNVNARFYDENQQRIHKDLSDKVLTINIDEHSFINQPDHQTGRLIDDDFDDMQEDIRQQVEKAREDGLYDYDPVSPPSSHASDDSFDENEFLSETERDSPTPRSSQMFRRPDDNMSESESEHEPASDKPANSTEQNSENESEYERNSNPRPPDQDDDIFDMSNDSFDGSNVHRTYSQRSDSSSDEEIIPSTQPRPTMIVPKISKT
jgi:hypothetical protein